jgi:hypothetical protein
MTAPLFTGFTPDGRMLVTEETDLLELWLHEQPWSGVARKQNCLAAEKTEPMWIFHDLTIRMPKIATTTVRKALAWERNQSLQKENQIEIPRGLVPVRAAAPISLRKAVYSCALFFRRELCYDFVQYEVNEEDLQSRAFLWVSDPDYTERHNVWGTCCFRWRKYKNADPLWSMQWAWLHPYARNHGLMTQAWPYFLARFGWFDVEPPYSQTMRYVLCKMGWVRPFAWGESHQSARLHPP